MTLPVVPRMTPKQYATKCGVTKETVYFWITSNRIPPRQIDTDGIPTERHPGSHGASFTRTTTNRLIIHVDWDQHPETPLFTEPTT